MAYYPPALALTSWGYFLRDTAPEREKGAEYPLAYYPGARFAKFLKGEAKIYNDNKRMCVHCYDKRGRKACGECQGVWYCSDECQDFNKGEHRPLCFKETKARAEVFSKALFETADIRHYIGICIALALKIHEDLKSEVPIHARIYLTLQPTVFSWFYHIVRRSHNSDIKVDLEGVVQIAAIKARRDPFREEDPYPSRKQRDWTKVRWEKGIEDHHRIPMALVEVFYQDDKLPTYVCGLPIEREAIIAAGLRRGKTVIRDTNGDILLKLPKTVNSGIEFLNTFIRMDKEDTLKLRGPLTGKDKRLIREACLSEDTDEPAVQRIKAQMARESPFGGVQLEN